MLRDDYKNIVFDLGGVLLNLNYSLTEAAFIKLGLTNFKTIYTQHLQTKLFEEFEKGNISSEEFRLSLRKHLRPDVSDVEIDAAWNAMLLDFPLERLQLLEKIKTNYRIFLLSNTNDIHLQAYSGYMQKTFGFKNELAHLFEKQYYSNRLGMRKPDSIIFEHVLTTNCLLPHETLFIDDSAQHIETAKKLGISTHWLNTKTENVLSLFN